MRKDTSIAESSKRLVASRSGRKSRPRTIAGVWIVNRGHAPIYVGNSIHSRSGAQLVRPDDILPLFFN